MKSCKVIYFSGDKSAPFYLSEILKSGITDGVRIWFLSYGRKDFQVKFKNDLRNGIFKEWKWENPKNIVLMNCKKHKAQGIKIFFK